MFSYTWVERHDEQSNIRYKEFLHTDGDAVVELEIAAEWGEAGVGLGPEEAEALGRRLLRTVRKSDGR